MVKEPQVMPQGGEKRPPQTKKSLDESDRVRVHGDIPAEVHDHRSDTGGSLGPEEVVSLVVCTNGGVCPGPARVVERAAGPDAIAARVRGVGGHKVRPLRAEFDQSPHIREGSVRGRASEETKG